MPITQEAAANEGSRNYLSHDSFRAKFDRDFALP